MIRKEMWSRALGGADVLVWDSQGNRITPGAQAGHRIPKFTKVN